ncbi:hypothetical protein BH09BAC3_BH09BAC3_32750 [soil metagenome]
MKIFLKSLLFLAIIYLILSCKEDDKNCPQGQMLLDSFSDGTTTYVLGTDGKAYSQNADGCQFIEQYFDPNFLNSNYLVKGASIYQYTNSTEQVKIRQHIEEDFEGYTKFIGLFMNSITDTLKNWNDVVLQSPANPSVQDYVALRKCLMNETCDFKDNRIDFASDPTTVTNTCLKFTSFAPTPSMVTSKSSIENAILFVDKADEIWYQADYYVEEGFPTTIVDLENKWFNLSPGIRLIFDDQQSLAVELKYGQKPYYRQSEMKKVIFPMKQWVRVKVYFFMDEGSGGKIKVWQDGVEIINLTGKTLPTSNSVQTNLEIGITATARTTVMFMDNIVFDVVHN